MGTAVYAQKWTPINATNLILIILILHVIGGSFLLAFAKLSTIARSISPAPDGESQPLLVGTANPEVIYLLHSLISSLNTFSQKCKLFGVTQEASLFSSFSASSSQLVPLLLQVLETSWNLWMEI